MGPVEKFLERIKRLRLIAQNPKVPPAARKAIQFQLDVAEMSLPKVARSPKDFQRASFWTLGARRNLQLHIGPDLRPYDPFDPSNIPEWMKRPMPTTQGKGAPPAPPARPKPPAAAPPKPAAPAPPVRWEPTPELDAEITAAMRQREAELIAQGVAPVDARVRAVDAGRDVAIKAGMPIGEANASAENLKRALAPTVPPPTTTKPTPTPGAAPTGGIDPEVAEGIRELMAALRPTGAKAPAKVPPVIPPPATPWKAVTDATALGKADAAKMVSRNALAHGEWYLLEAKVRPPGSQYGRLGPDGKPLWEATIRLSLKKPEKAKFRPDLTEVKVSETSLYGYANTEAEARQLAEDLFSSVLVGTPKITRPGGVWTAIKGGWMLRTKGGYGVVRYGPKGTHYQVNLVHESGEVELLAEGAVPGRAREIAQDVVTNLIPR